MKLVLLLLFICINYSLSLSPDESKKYLVKSYPKKVWPGMLQYHDSGKYVKRLPTKKPGPDTGYTAFLPINNQNTQLNVPESPYFPLDNKPDAKPRVKKVLIDSQLPVRSKRSVDEKKTAKPVVKKINPPAPQAALSPKPGANKKIKPRRPLRNIKGKGRGKRAKRTGGKKMKQAGSKGHAKERPQKKKRHAARAGHSKLKYSPAQQKKKKLSKLQPKNLKGHKGARRLIAARDALIDEYPYVISIQKGGQHWCAGALLNPRLIITTANCLWRSDRLSRMRVRAGSRHTDRDGQTARIAQVMKHPGWKIRRNPDNDVALALLDRSIKFSHVVHGVDLPNRVMIPAFDDAWITSYGTDRRDGVYDTQGMSLQVYHARLMDRGKCNNITQRFGVHVTENFICLAQTGRRAPCTRDTGAPAVSDGVLWGLASWGIRKLCGTERFPAMFSYLASSTNMDFIANASHYLMADERYYPYMDKFPFPRIHVTTPSTTPEIVF